MNAAYVMGARMTDAFARNGWCTAIRGAEGGGKVEGAARATSSPATTATSTCNARPRSASPTAARPSLSEAGLSAALPLQEHRLCRVLRRPDDPEAEEVRPARRDCERGNLGAAALYHGHVAVRPLPEGHGPRQDRLVQGGQRRRSLAEPLDQQLRQLQPERRARKRRRSIPLREARIRVKEIPGKPGSYNAVAHMRPWLQMEELTTSLRMVARIPTLQK